MSSQDWFSEVQRFVCEVFVEMRGVCCMVEVFDQQPQAWGLDGFCNKTGVQGFI